MMFSIGSFDMIYVLIPTKLNLCLCVYYKEFVAGVETPSMAQKWALV